jgi:hypothetical protein
MQQYFLLFYNLLLLDRKVLGRLQWLQCPFSHLLPDREETKLCGMRDYFVALFFGTIVGLPLVFCRADPLE